VLDERPEDVVEPVPEQAPSGDLDDGAWLAQDLLGGLAGGAQVVVCDLSNAGASATKAAEALRAVRGYLVEWPAVGVVVVGPLGHEVQAALGAPPLPDTVVFSKSADAGVSLLLGRLPPLQSLDLHLSARLTSPREARAFIVRSLLAWRLMPLVPPAALVVSELVTNAVVHAATTVDVSLRRADDRVQLAVHDSGGGSPVARDEDPRRQLLGGRGLLLVQGSARSWGVLLARPSGKTVWAVFDAHRDRAGQRLESADAAP
jgi:Histidine kinase-like ATPase domain